MLKYYVDENGELKSSQDSDLVVQTSKGVDTIQVTLPSDYVMASHTASVSIRNPKGVESDAYLMTYNSTDNTLTYLLNNAWFTSLKGNYEFTIRVYGTTEYTTNENGGVDLVTNSTTTIQVFTKGYYKVLEAVNVGTTPTIPTTTEEEIYKAIGEVDSRKADTTYVDTKDDALDNRIKVIESDYTTEAQVQDIVDNTQKVEDVSASSTPMSIQVTTMAGTETKKTINIALPDDVCSVDEEEDGEIPNIEVESAKYSDTTKALNNTITLKDDTISNISNRTVNTSTLSDGTIQTIYSRDETSERSGTTTHRETTIEYRYNGQIYMLATTGDSKDLVIEMYIDPSGFIFELPNDEHIELKTNGITYFAPTTETTKTNYSFTWEDLYGLFARVKALEDK